MPLPAPASERPARSPRRATLALTFALAAPAPLGCSQRALVGREHTLTQDPAPHYDAAFIDGPGYVDGRVQAHAVFNTVERVYWFNTPGAQSIKIYIFEDAPSCDDLSKSGWVTSPKVRPADLMGITLGGTSPGV